MENFHTQDITLKATSHDLAFTLMQGNIAFQMGLVDSLDSKANSTQVASSALVSAALVLEAALVSLAKSSVLGRLLQAVALLPLLIAYILSIYYASKGYSIRKWDQVPNPEELFEHLNTPEDKLKAELLSPLKTAFTNNETKIEEKSGYIHKSIQWLRIETILLAITIIVQAVIPLVV